MQLIGLWRSASIPAVKPHRHAKHKPAKAPGPPLARRQADLFAVEWR
jgi:hypothetical protein